MKTDPKARYQGYSFYFREGLCWSDINTTFLKCRKKQRSINDVKSMSIYGTTGKVPEDFIITLINSTLISYYVDTFVNNTQTFQINDARQLPIVIPSTAEMRKAADIVAFAIECKKSHNDSPMKELQTEVDTFVQSLYRI